MPTNQQRRDAAKRKLERQLVRRQQQAKVRRQRTIIASIVAGVLLVGGAIWLITSNKSSTDSTSGADTSSSGTETSESTPTTPCSYPTTDQAAAREVEAPTNLNPARTGTVDVTINLGQGAVPATLDRELAPCAVNAFLSLASQGFYNDTPCHRLTDEPAFHILQCGDPSGTGRGGPGFDFANESSELKQSEVGTETSAASTDAASTDAAATDTASTDATATDTASTDTGATDTAATDTTTSTTPAHYPVGTLAMASTAPDGKNGSQFFIVYGETTIDSPGYTKIGTVSDAGLSVVQGIAAKGTIANDQGVADKPAEAVTITDVVVPTEAVGAEAPPSSAAETTDAGTFPTDTVATEATPTDTAATGTDGADPGATDAPATDTSPPTG